MRFILALVFICASMSFAWAEDSDELDEAIGQVDGSVSEQPETTSAPAKTAKIIKGTNVLDFEADVIEGQRKAPQLFLQMQIETVNLDSVVYLRKNFNDFHSLEKDRKPVYRLPRR